MYLLADLVPIGTSIEKFKYNSSFAAPPPSDGGNEPIWDSMIPSKCLMPSPGRELILSIIVDGLGYVANTAMASETSVLSAFHQLHCLVSLAYLFLRTLSDLDQYTVRRAYYSTNGEGELEDFDLGKERRPHVAHCFDYLRQGILCSADSTIEPAVDTVNGFLGAGFPRTCRNFQGLKSWAEDHRAFDARGFLVEKEAR